VDGNGCAPADSVNEVTSPVKTAASDSGASGEAVSVAAEMA
jgi:hypothetical protein